MEEPLGRQLAITGKLVRERFDCCLGHHGSSLATWAVLRSADDEAGLSQRELAARMSIESPTLVRHLDRMDEPPPSKGKTRRKRRGPNRARDKEKRK